MTRLLFVTPRLAERDLGGRELLSRLHWRCLEDLLDEQPLLHELEPATVGIREVPAALRGRIDGVTLGAERALLNRIARERVDAVFLNGSNLGRLAQSIKRTSPSTQVLTFCHNVERSFFRGALRRNPSIRAALVLAANTAAERLAVRFSDRLIALSERDSALFSSIYGRGATDILPMALEDTAPDQNDTTEPLPPAHPYLLFVGGGFYANRSGIRWFASHVAARSPLPTCVVGRGLDKLRDELEQSGNLRLIGSVDDLGPWYAGAVAALAPIFDGSGMKTKVAEALMHGKPVIGTAEAFSGYETPEARQASCETPDDFLRAIHDLKDVPPAFDPTLRLLFERHYSYEAARDRLKAILNKALTSDGG